MSWLTSPAVLGRGRTTIAEAAFEHDRRAAGAGAADVQVVAANVDYPGLAADEEARLDQVWDAGQQHWMSLSPLARFVSVDNTGHDIQLDRPDVVLDQIQRLLP